MKRLRVELLGERDRPVLRQRVGFSALVSLSNLEILQVETAPAEIIAG
jgi:hypothetical protein